MIARRRFIALALVALVAFGFGAALGKGDKPGPIHWVGTPRTGVAGDGEVLYGTIVNRAKTPIRLPKGAVKALDGGGDALPTAAAFAGGYVLGLAPGTPSAAVILRPGGRLPVAVAWTGDASRVAVGGSRLVIPK